MFYLVKCCFFHDALIIASKLCIHYNIYSNMIHQLIISRVKLLMHNVKNVLYHLFYLKFLIFSVVHNNICTDTCITLTKHRQKYGKRKFKVVQACELIDFMKFLKLIQHKHVTCRQQILQDSKQYIYIYTHIIPYHTLIQNKLKKEFNYS